MAGPTYVLESSGQPTTGCFSRLQSYFVLAGTNDGTLNLWDLRESNSLHKDRYLSDLLFVSICSIFPFTLYSSETLKT